MNWENQKRINIRSRALVAMLVASSAFMIACASHPVATTGAQGAIGSAPESSSASVYRLGAGDELSIKFFYTPELNERQIIRPDEMISMPLIGEVRAGGLSPAELRESLVKAYSTKYLKTGSTEIQVTVSALNSARVFVGGEVARAGAQPLIGRMTLSRVIMLAQGFAPTAYTSQVLLIHAGADGRPEVHQVNVKDALLEGGDDPVVSSEDIVFVPRSPIARVDLFVEQFLRSAIPFTTSVSYNFTNGVRVY